MSDHHLFPILSKFKRLTWRADDPNLGECQCPAHEDSTNSLHVTIKTGDNGQPKLMLLCHAGCKVLDICLAVGETFSSLFPDRTRGNGFSGNGHPSSSAGKKGGGGSNGTFVCAYDYRDASGVIQHQTVRWEPKHFTQRRRVHSASPVTVSGIEYTPFRDPLGNYWISTLKGIEPLIYDLPRILAAPINKVIFQCEGEKDAETLKKKFGFYTTTVPMGAGKWRKSHRNYYRGRRVAIIPDTDKPRIGQTDPAANTGYDGARKIASELVGVAAEVRIVYLPNLFDLTPKWDLTDWIEAGGTKEQFVEAFNSAPILTAGHPGLIPAGSESANLPSPPAGTAAVQKTITNTAENSDGTSRPLPMVEIVRQIRAVSGGWPYRVGKQLFAYVDDRLSFFETHSQLFGWLGSMMPAPPYISQGGCFHSKQEVFDELCRDAEEYLAIERYPHQPRIHGHFYAHKELPEAHGQHLENLLNRFNPAHEVDKQLLLAFLLTLIWGGKKRPCFVITADGEGAGKTTFVEIGASLVGGCMSFSLGDEIDKIKARLLSKLGLSMRVGLFDNAKSRKLSWADLEALVTCEMISGRANYVGEGSRPNSIVWVITANGAAFSQDMAQRSIVIRLRKPKYSGSWESDTQAYVTEHREEILADLLWYMDSGRSPLAKNTRWGAWENDILRRLINPDEVQRVIVERQREIDVDCSESEIIENYFAEQLLDLGYDAKDSVFIPAKIVTKWLCEVINEKLTSTKASQEISERIESGIITRMKYKKRPESRGFIWFTDWSPGDDYETDLGQKIEIREREIRNNRIHDDATARMEAMIGGKS